MKNRKALVIILFTLFALPIPLSLLSWIGTIISVANISMMNWNTSRGVIQGLTALATMLLAGTYLITYIFSLVITIKHKKLSSLSFLPLLHIFLFIVSMSIWS